MNTVSHCDIFLTTLNARYLHAALGLRYLLANMGDLADRTHLREFVIDQRPADIVEQILAARPRIVGFGVYIWNVAAVTRVVRLLKSIAPDVVVVLGGPEVSHEPEDQEVVALADYLVTGQADLAFAELCREILTGSAPHSRLVAGGTPDLGGLALPYGYYGDTDIAHRFLYVEASRGCPFKCQFCLSSLDRTAWPFDVERFLGEIDRLHRRGARHFRFVDRTFNLKAATSRRILEFFLERMDPELFVHFEVIPDHLPNALRELLPRFPPGALQFEVGIQTFNPRVQALIERRHHDERACDNLRWLRHATHAHIHADLIFGLPGEDLESFARGFDKLVALAPHEIQIGILKRLRGTAIARHAERFGLVFNPDPPYDVLRTDRISFAEMQELYRFSRYWDMIANSGRFPNTLPLLLDGDPFARFRRFSGWLWDSVQRCHGIALPRLFDQLFTGLCEALHCDAARASEALRRDARLSGLANRDHAFVQDHAASRGRPELQCSRSRRQQRHLLAGGTSGTTLLRRKA